MNASQKSEALRLADKYEAHGFLGDHRFAQEHWCRQAATELRSQHARITDLEVQLSAIGAGGVEPLRKHVSLQAVHHAEGVPEQVVELEVDDLIDRLLNAQQDLNLAANVHMDQSIASASTLLDEVEIALRTLAATPAAGELATLQAGLQAAAPAVLPEPVSSGMRLVNAGALQMVINALRRDAEEGKAVRGEMADELLATGGQAQADALDAARYRWLRNQMLGVDFDWCGNGITALVFEVPDGCAYSRNCDQSIDAAVAAQAKHGEPKP